MIVLWDFTNEIKNLLIHTQKLERNEQSKLLKNKPSNPQEETKRNKQRRTTETTVK